MKKNRKMQNSNKTHDNSVLLATNSILNYTQANTSADFSASSSLLNNQHLQQYSVQNNQSISAFNRPQTNFVGIKQENNDNFSSTDEEGDDYDEDTYSNSMNDIKQHQYERFRQALDNETNDSNSMINMNDTCDQMSYMNPSTSSQMSSSDAKRNKSAQLSGEQKGELICVVCGASANGYNFDAITCESCKAFFRRNAFRPLNLFRCTNNNQCVITINTRKKCKKCRITKCFNLGMRRDWIMTEVEREEKRRKIEENRRKKTTSNPNDQSLDMSNDQSMNSCNESSSTRPIRRRRRRRRHSSLLDRKNDSSVMSHDNSDSFMKFFGHNGAPEIPGMPSLATIQTSLSAASAAIVENGLLQQMQHSPKMANNGLFNPAYSPAFLQQAAASLAAVMTSPNSPSSSLPNPSTHLNVTNPLATFNNNFMNQIGHAQHLHQHQSTLPFHSNNLHTYHTHHSINQTQHSSRLNNSFPSLEPFYNHVISKSVGNNNSNTMSMSANDFENMSKLNGLNKHSNLHDNKKTSMSSCLNKLKKEQDQSNKHEHGNQNCDIGGKLNFEKSEIPFCNINLNTNTTVKPEKNVESEQLSSHAFNSNNSPKSVDTRYTISPTSVMSITSPLASPDNSNSSSKSYKLSDTERQHVSIIAEAYKQAIHLVKAQGLPNNSEDINTTINLTELGVRRIIFFFKLISDFRNLPHDTMVKLLKQNMMNLLQVHGVISFNKQDNTFKEPDTDDTPFSAESLQAVYGPEIYQFSMNITRNLYDLCDDDMVFIKILMLIVIFDPLNASLNADEKALISKLQNKYVALIYSYMRDKFGSPKAELMFKGMVFELSKVSELSRCFERAIAQKSNSEYVRPLMKEVFSFPSNHNTPPSSSSDRSSYSSCPSSYSSKTYSHETPSTSSSFISDTSYMANSTNCVDFSSATSPLMNKK